MLHRRCLCQAVDHMHTWPSTLSAPAPLLRGLRQRVADNASCIDLSNAPDAVRAQATVKERFKTLNGSIAAIHESQSGWTVPDATLRANLKARLGGTCCVACDIPGAHWLFCRARGKTQWMSASTSQTCSQGRTLDASTSRLASNGTVAVLMC